MHEKLPPKLPPLTLITFMARGDSLPRPQHNSIGRNYRNLDWIFLVWYKIQIHFERLEINLLILEFKFIVTRNFDII